MLDNYPWLRAIRARFHSAMQEDNLAHAILFTGLKGVGKQLLVQTLAADILSADSKQAHLVNSEAGHPDQLEVFPEGALGMVKVESIRKVTDFLQTTAQQGGYKVVVLHEVDKMNVSAANALLKSLEEPPAKTIMLLTTSSVDRVLPTIASRCQQWSVAVTDDETHTWLESQGLLNQADTWFKLYAKQPLELLKWLNDENASLYLQALDKLFSVPDPLQFAREFEALQLSIFLDLVMVKCREKASEPGRQKASPWLAMWQYCMHKKKELNAPIKLNASLQWDEVAIKLSRCLRSGVCN